MAVACSLMAYVSVNFCTLTSKCCVENVNGLTVSKNTLIFSERVNLKEEGKDALVLGEHVRPCTATSLAQPSKV